MSTLGTRPIETTKSPLWRNDSFLGSFIPIHCAHRRGDAARMLAPFPRAPLRFPARWPLLPCKRALFSDSSGARSPPSHQQALKTRSPNPIPNPCFIRSQSIPIFFNHESPPSAIFKLQANRGRARQVRVGPGKASVLPWLLMPDLLRSLLLPLPLLMDRLWPPVNPSPKQQQHLQHLQVLKPRDFLRGGEVHLRLAQVTGK